VLIREIRGKKNKQHIFSVCLLCFKIY